MKTISEMMSPSPMTIGPEDKIEQAWRVMHDNRMRHIPVCKGDKLVGLVTQKDLLVNASNTALLSLPVAEIMVFDVETIDVSSSPKDAAQLMIKKKISCLPVLDGEELVGIVTDTDFLSLVELLLE